MSVPTLHSEAAAAIAEIEPSVVRAHTVPIPDDDDDSTGTDVTDEDAVRSRQSDDTERETKR